MGRTHVVAGLRARSGESLAVRAGGVVFTGALGAAHIAAGTSWSFEEEAAMTCAALARTLQALGTGLDRTAKRKGFLPDIRRLGALDRALPEAMRRAVRVDVGAGLPSPEDRLGIELVCGADSSPHVFGAGPTRAARLENLVFTGGCGPFAGADVVCAGDLHGQGTRALQTVRDCLSEAGATTADLVKVNNTTASWHDYRLYNAAYNDVLAGSNAARCSVSGALRHPLALIEVEAVAALGERLAFVDSTRSGVGRDDFAPRADTRYLPELGPCKGPHSHGARAGRMVFIAGECPYDAEDRLIGPGDIEAQTLRTLENVRIELEALGAGLADVVKTSVTLSDMRLSHGFERAYRSVFRPPYPARSVVATPLGQYGILVEIEAIAVIGAAADAAFAVGEA